MASELTREALAAHAAARNLVLDLLDPAGPGELPGAAATLPFTITTPNGVDTPLPRVSDAAEDKLIEIEGFVDQIRVVRSSDGKLIGQLRLSDPANDTIVFAAAVFVQPLHVGITVGSFVRLSGVFRANSVLRDGEPTVEADRLALAQLSSRAWRFAFLRSAEPFYEPWRNQTNMYWSLGPHDPAPDDAAPRQGAGELIYAPFIRGGEPDA